MGEEGMQRILPLFNSQQIWNKSDLSGAIQGYLISRSSLMMAVQKSEGSQVVVDHKCADLVLL